MQFMDEAGIEKRRPYGKHLASLSSRNKTSNNFLCGVKKWVQGDYIDDGGLNEADGSLNHHVKRPLTGLGIEYGDSGIEKDGFPHGRHLRANYNNITKIGESGEFWEWGQVFPPSRQHCR